jgi:site-specific DNA recombinase
LELAVWPDVCALLAPPRRLAEAYQRRAHPNSPPTRTLLTTRDAQLGQRRQGLARLIDRDAEALIEQPAFEPRLTRLRQRLAHVEAQRQQLAEEDALHTDVRLMIGRLEDFAAQVQEGLVEADWRRTREMIRALVTRVEVVHDQVNVVFRTEPRPGDPSPEKKSLQDCRGSTDASYGHLVLRLWAGLVLLYTARFPLKGWVTMEEMVFSLNHHWRFLTSELLE